MARIEWSAVYCFCLSACLSVVNFNLRYNFWTVKDRDFILSMHTPLMMPFQMTQKVNDLVTLTLTLKLKIQWWFINPGSDNPEFSLVWKKAWEPISESNLMGDSVIRKTHQSGNIGREQMCPV